MKPILLSSCLLLMLSCGLKKDKLQADISTLPSFDMLLMDSVTMINTKEIPTGNPILFIYFRPDCPHCQEEAKELVTNINALKKFRIYFLAGGPFEDVKNFCIQFHLDQYKNISVVNDYNHSFKQVFKPELVPYIALYNGHKQLIKIYNAEVPVNSLVNASKI
jgi:hypothetical protein